LLSGVGEPLKRIARTGHMSNSRDLKLPNSALSVTLLVLCLTGCNPTSLPGLRTLAKKEDERQQREADEAIKNNPVFRELDHLCREEIPLFQGFVLVGKHASTNKRKFLTYFFTSKAEFTEVRDFYKQYFSKNNWQTAEQREGGWGSDVSEFRSGSYRFILYHEGLGDADFAFHCEKVLQEPL
jgi:hypothetical protein